MSTQERKKWSRGIWLELAGWWGIYTGALNCRPPVQLKTLLCFPWAQIRWATWYVSTFFLLLCIILTLDVCFKKLTIHPFSCFASHSFLLFRCGSSLVCCCCSHGRENTEQEQLLVREEGMVGTGDRKRGWEKKVVETVGPTNWCVIFLKWDSFSDNPISFREFLN
jgi:hypothetical protein